MPFISKEEVAQKRVELKRALPEFKLSVRRVRHSSISVDILEGPIAMLPEGKSYESVNQYYIDEHYADQPQVREVLKTIYNVLSRDQRELVYDLDYGSVPNFYVNMSIGRWDKPYVVKAPKAAKSVRVVTRDSILASANEKYPEGYLPKIQYWTERMSQEAAKGNLAGVEYASKKVQYFMQRQEALSA